MIVKLWPLALQIHAVFLAEILPIWHKTLFHQSISLQIHAHLIHCFKFNYPNIPSLLGFWRPSYQIDVVTCSICILEFIIPHATSCGGYNVFDPSVSQSVSQSVSSVFLVSATPLKPLNRISWNYVVMHIHRNFFDSIFSTELRPSWT